MDFAKIKKNIFQFPEHTGEEQNRRAHIFNLTSIVTGSAIFLFVIYYGFFDRSYNIVPMVFLLLITIVSFFINKRGLTDFASYLLIWSALIGIFSLAAFNDGVNDTALQTIPGLLIIAAMLFERRHLIILAILFLCLLISLGLFQFSHPLLFSDSYKTSITDIFDLIIIDSAIIILVVLISTYLKESITKVKHKERRLNESEERFRTLIEHASDGLEVIDINGFYVEVNSATLQQLGFTRDEILKLTIFDIDPNLTRDYFEKMKHNITSLNPLRMESLHRRKDGSTFPVELSISAIHLDGSPHTLASVRDITERKCSEAKLKESEERFRSLYENTAIGLYRTTREGKILLANPALVEKLGYSTFEELAERNLQNEGFEPSYERKRFIEQIEKDGKVKGIESAWTCQNGSIIYVRESAQAVRDADGKTLYYDGTAEDITERKHIEDTLRKSKLMYDELASKISVGIYILHSTPKGTFELDYVSPKMAEMFNMTMDTPLADPSFVFRAIHPDESEDFIKMNQERIKLQQPFFWEGRVIVNETNKWYRISSSPNQIENGDILWHGVVADITEQKRSEEELSKLSNAIENSSDAIFLTDTKGFFTRINPGFTNIYGYTADEVIGKCTPRILKSGLIQKEQYDNFWKSLLNHKEMKGEWTNRRKDGMIITIEGSSNPILNEKQAIIGFLGIQRDITNRKQIDRELLNSEEKYRGLVDNSPDAITIYIDGKIVFVNLAAVHLLHAKNESDLLGRSVVDFVHPDYQEFVIKRMSNISTMGHTLPMAEEKFIRFDGNSVDVEVKATPIIFEKKPAVQIIARDISERKKNELERKTLQEQLLQSQKLESIGTLASGIAHDFNNILNVIVGNTNLLINSSLDEKTAQRVNAISNVSERATHLVKQLLMFARKTKVDYIPFFINDIIEDTIKFLAETFPKTITFTLELEKRLPKITADPNQIHQVLMNLSVNGRDAMPSGGSFTFRTSITPGDILRKQFYQATANQYIRVAVKDTGLGMNEETIQKIFDPFYTTKEVGKGTGLGMSVVQGIIRSHDGFIKVHSQINFGTEIEIYFPVPDEEQPTILSDKSETTSNLAGRETILLIEDEKLTRDIAEDILHSNGYTVFLARNGSEGVDLFEKNKDRINIVVSDFGLPKFNGEEVFRHIKEINPTMLFILMSGYLEPEIIDRLSKFGVNDIIAKPFKPNELLLRIRKTLDSDGKHQK